MQSLHLYLVSVQPRRAYVDSEPFIPPVRTLFPRCWPRSRFLSKRESHPNLFLQVAESAACWWVAMPKGETFCLARLGGKTGTHPRLTSLHSRRSVGRPRSAMAACRLLMPFEI